LTSNEVDQLLKMLQSMILSHALVYDCNAVFEVIMQLCSQFSIKKKLLAKSSDLDKEFISKEPLIDDSPSFVTMEILVETVKTVIDQLNKPTHGSTFSRISQFLLDKLSFGYSPAIRAKAAEGLCVLSESQLESVVLLFTRRVTNCKNEDQWRDYAICQRYMV
jgi:hypothetical protein